MKYPFFATIKYPFLAVMIAIPAFAQQPSCPEGLVRSVEMLARWNDYISDKLNYEPFSAMKELKDAATSLSARLDSLDLANTLIRRYTDVFDEIEVQGGNSSLAVEKLFQQIRWSVNSLQGVAACLERVPVNVQSIAQTKISGAVAMMFFIRPEIFAAIDVVNAELRASGQGSFEEYDTLFASLHAINTFIHVSGGNLSLCESQLLEVESRNVVFSVDPYFIEDEKPFAVVLGPPLSQLTVGAACQG